MRDEKGFLCHQFGVTEDELDDATDAVEISRGVVGEKLVALLLLLILKLLRRTV